MKWHAHPAMMSALGVFAAGLLLVEANVLGARHYARLDFSESREFTPSEPTKKLLESLGQRVLVTVLLPRSHPLLPDLRQHLKSYMALSKSIEVDYLDPDLDAAKFLALAKKIELQAESLRGSPTESAALVLVSTTGTWVVPTSRLSSTDDEGRLLLHMEAELTEGIARVNRSEERKVCFVTGHGELSIDDHGPQGLLELGRRLERTNTSAVRVPLDVPDPEDALEDCDAVAVMGPGRPWPKAHAALLNSFLDGGGSLSVFVDPIIDDQGHVVPSGLEAVLGKMGALLEPALVLERAASKRLPQGFGEAFFAEPKTHATTEGLSSDTERLDSRLAVSGSVFFRPKPGVSASVLFTTSADFGLVCDLDEPEGETCPPALLDRAGRPHEEAGAPRDGLALAIASEKVLTGGRGRARYVTVGTTSVAQNAAMSDPASYGSRVFTENAFAWLLERPTLVSVPEHPTVRAGMKPSQESLEALLLYVLVYLPLFSAGLGAWVITRRYRREQLGEERREAS